MFDRSIKRKCNEINNIYASTIVSIQNHTQNDDETTTTIRTFDETISIPWEPYNNMKSTSWDSYSPTDFDNNTYECNNVNHNLEQQEEEMKNRNQLPIISKEDLDIVAHTFYLRKKEMENVSYPDPVETELSFYDCQQELNDITHVTILKVETLDSGQQTCNQTRPVLNIKAPISNAQIKNKK